MSTTYEWTYEVTDEHGDIVDQEFYDTLAECMNAAPQGADIALMRRVVGPNDDGDADQLERGYAYLEDGALPPRFDDGATVPQKYHRQVGMVRS